MKTARFLVQKGFTLVELLIVIALIGILAVAILAAINPLEQLNRARDTGMESDASQLLAAIDRYYAAHEEFPWTTITITRDTGFALTDITNEDSMGYTSAQNELVGVCGTDCTTDDGILLTDLELKTEFRRRRFILNATADIDRLWLGKGTGASSGLYACWVARSMAKRNQSAVSFVAGSGTPNDYNVDGTDCDPLAADADFSDIESACLYCIPGLPETNIP